MKAKRQKVSSGSSEPTPGPAAEELPERWSVQRKTELVLRLVRGCQRSFNTPHLWSLNVPRPPDRRRCTAPGFLDSALAGG